MNPHRDKTRNLYIYEVQGEISVESPAFLGAWLEGGLVYLFFSSPQDHLVAGAAETCRARVLKRTVLPEKLWRPKVDLPLRVGRFVIVDLSHREPPEPGTIEMRIRPGLVFGGGDHPTTRACLVALDRLLDETTPERVLDLGTGTGILAIAAALAGSPHVRAVDINPLAVENARENVALNGVSSRVKVFLSDGLHELKGGDLVFMNTPQSLITRAAKGLTVYGRIIVSGFLPGQEAGVLEALEMEGLRLLARFEDEGWPALVFRGLK